MTTRATLGTATVLLLALAVPLLAHHNLIADFSLDRPVSLRGTLVRLEWINPHGWIYLAVKGAGGQTEDWAVETGSPFAMTRRGLQREDFKPGIEVIVVGYAARDGSRKAAGIAVTFLDREAKAIGEASFTLGR